MRPQITPFNEINVLRRDVSLSLNAANFRFPSDPDSGCSDLSASTLRMSLHWIVSALCRVKVDANRKLPNFLVFFSRKDLGFADSFEI